jgi:vancomycin resistance protein YoaR
MTTSFETPSVHKNDLAAQLIAVLLGGIILFFFVLLVWTLGYQLMYAGRIFPGVSVAGVDLSGMRPADAAIKLNQRLAFPYQGQILLRDGERIWAASPAELGMVFDASASARSAYKIGRSGGLLGAFAAQLEGAKKGISADAVIIFDQHLAYAYLQKLAVEIDQPPREAALAIQGTDVVAQPGQVGRYLNVDASLLALSAQLQSFRDGEVLLTVEEIQPQLVDVSSQAEKARQILSAPLVLNLAAGQPGPWIFDAQTVAEMLLVRKTDSENGSRLEVALDPSSLAEIVSGIAEEVNRPAKNARFVFNDETRQLDLLQNAIIGRVLDVGRNVALVNEGILAGAHEIELEVLSDEPAVVDTSTAAELGITELIHAETSYFYGSSAERVQNVQRAAAAFHGILIAPGETFSMGSALGDISLDNGYAEALIIYGGRTIKGVGGGVCQVSTTLFRTTFFAGFPIVERHSHAYRVYYYEQNADGSRNPNLAGLDATVYVPLVDFKFTNDTPYWLLMETYTNAAGRSLTWKFYSTSDGRTVDWQTTGTRNIVSAPKPLFVESDELAKNEIKQVDWSADGADVSITRQVFREGQLYFEDIFNTHYEPWQAVCEYGAETKNPEKKAKEQGLCY